MGIWSSIALLYASRGPLDIVLASTQFSDLHDHASATATPSASYCHVAVQCSDAATEPSPPNLPVNPQCSLLPSPRMHELGSCSTLECATQTSPPPPPPAASIPCALDNASAFMQQRCVISLSSFCFRMLSTTRARPPVQSPVQSCHWRFSEGTRLAEL